MEAVRCTQCGATRWTLLPGSLASALEAPCEMCGGDTVLERRRPGAHRGRLPVERRRAATVDRIRGGSRTRLRAR